MLQWNDGDWEQRAYWGQNLINAGTNGTASRRYMGAIPSATGWVRLEVPASLVGLEGVTINGMAFTLYGGHTWWDRAGVRHNSWRGTKYYRFNGQVVAMRKNGVLSYLHGDHLGSTVATSNSSGNFSGQEWYHAYGRYRGGHELGTENRFTGQKLDGAGLMYFNARYYDPELGQFLSPDTLVPDPTNLFAWNRYMYTIGNPMRYNDPSGHNWEDVIVTVVDFAQGVGAQVGYNNTVIALPSEINSFAPQAGESTSMQVGRFVGNVVTAVQGVAEISGGAGLGGAGVAACATGVGCVATAPAVVGASAVIAHGATVATIGAVNAGTQLGNVVMAMMEGGQESKPSSYYRSGTPYRAKELKDDGATMLRRDTANVDSQPFKDYIRSLDKSFRYNEWKKVMETWEYPGGRRVENHYWRNTKTGESYYHE